MNQLINGNQVVMTSVEMVDFINQFRAEMNSSMVAGSKLYPMLRHDNFMLKVVDVLGDSAPKFLGTEKYQNGTGGMVDRQIYRLPKREACLMAMSYSYDLQARVFDRMTELEGAIKPKIPQTYAAALLEAGRLALEVERQAEQLRLAAPKVEFVEKYIDSSSGSLGFRKVAKLLNVKEPVLRAFLAKEKIMYKLGGEWVPYQNHIEAGRFEVKAGLAEHEESSHAFTQSKFTAKGVEWIAGEYAKHKINKQLESVK